MWRAAGVSSSPSMPRTRAMSPASTYPGRRPRWRVSGWQIASPPERRRLSQGDAAALPWKDATFSAVTCMDAFPFFPAPERVLAEVLRVLRPGGRMLWQIGMKWPHGIPKHMPHPTSRVVSVSDEAAVRKLVEDAGFGEISISYGPVFGEHRLGNLASRLTGGSDEVRLVGAVKPEVGSVR